MNIIKLFIFCMCLTVTAGAQGFRFSGPFATSDQAILNQSTLQDGSSFYVHHGSATNMEAGTVYVVGSLTIAGENVIDKINSVGVSTGALKTEVDALHSTTATLTTEVFNLSASTTSIQNELDASQVEIAALSVSTQSLQDELDGSQVEIAALSVSTQALEDGKVDRAGDVMTGQLTIAGSSLTVGGNVQVDGPLFTVGGSTLVTRAGMVGIGTTDPQAPLEVKYDIVNSTVDVILRNDALATIQNVEGGCLIHMGVDSALNDTNYGSACFLQTNRNNGSEESIFTVGLPVTGVKAERLRMKGNGDMGLNDTSPDGQLDIISKSAPTGYILSISSQTDTTGDILSVLGNGYVGVNTAVPTSQLVITSNNDGPDSLSIIHGTTNPNDPVDVWVGSQSVMKMTANGWVGLGDTTPDARLDVVGGLIVTSSATVSGGVYVVDSGIVISTTTGSQGIRFQDYTLQTTAYDHQSSSYGVAGTTSVASTAYVGVSTSTFYISKNLRPHMVFVRGYIQATATGGERNYTIALAEDGVVDHEFPLTLQSTDWGVLPGFIYEPQGDTIGDHTYSVWIKSDNANGTQIAGGVTLALVEY